MKEHPILFSGPLVRAIRGGHKTVTRRLVTARHVDDIHTWEFHRIQDGYADGDVRAVFVDPDEGEPIGVRCPFGAVGHFLWTRETWAPADIMYQDHANDVPSVIAYQADRSAILYEARKPTPVPAYDIASWNWDALKWKPSIHMPRWASRDNLVVVDIGVERLQDITEEDAIAEGVDAVSLADVPRQAAFSRRQDFSRLWETVYGAGSWASNPYVWVVSFKVLRGAQ